MQVLTSHRLRVLHSLGAEVRGPDLGHSLPHQSRDSTDFLSAPAQALGVNV